MRLYVLLVMQHLVVYTRHLAVMVAIYRANTPSAARKSNFPQLTLLSRVHLGALNIYKCAIVPKELYPNRVC